MLCLEEIKNMILSGHDSSGSECRFYSIGGIGIKTWYDEGTAVACFEKQRTIAQLGLAPQIYGEVFESFDSDGDYIWGYQTEIADILGDNYESEKERRCYYDLIGEVEGKLTANGWKDEDAHIYNYGVLSSGVIVCIDFDYVHFYENGYPFAP